MNPFGVPITKETLMQMSKYRGKKIRQEDMAGEAMRLINAEGKNIKALEYALKLKRDYGSGCSTLCLIYNATGGRLDMVDKKDYDGGVYQAEPPRSFENGQWLAFLHIHGGCLPSNSSVGARVYRATDSDAGGAVRDFMIAWQTPWDPSPTHAYTEVRAKDHFPAHWNYIKGLINKARKITKDESDPYFSSIVSIGGITSPEFIAVLKHKYSK